MGDAFEWFLSHSINADDILNIDKFYSFYNKKSVIHAIHNLIHAVDIQMSILKMKLKKKSINKCYCWMQKTVLLQYIENPSTLSKQYLKFPFNLK